MNGIPFSIPPDLAGDVARAAQAQGVSVEEFVKISLQAAVARTKERDPFFADDAVFTGPTPPDLSARHDDYLYDDLP